MAEFKEQYIVWETDLHQSKSSKCLVGVGTDLEAAYSIGSSAVRDSFFNPKESLIVINSIEVNACCACEVQHLATDSDKVLDFLTVYEPGQGMVYEK